MAISRSCLMGLSLVLLATASQLRADPPTAVFKDGHWVAIAPPPSTVVVAADPLLDHMQQLLDTHDYSAALDVGISWVKNHGDKAPQRDRCLFLIAVAKFNIPVGDNRVSSYYYCDELMDEYPESKLFYPALDLQYRIAEGYLNGYQDGILGTPFTLPFVGDDGKGEEMLYRIQQRSPGSPLAEKALLRTCDYYYSKGQYQLAHDAYGFYIKSYPRSEKLAQIKLRQAFSSLAQYHGVRFDLTCLIDARTEFSDFIAAYPVMAKEQNVKALIARIDTTLARKLLVTADFYRRTHALTGAVYMYRYLIETYPDSADAATAKTALAALPSAVLAEPPPRPSNGFSLPAAPGGAVMMDHPLGNPKCSMIVFLLPLLAIGLGGCGYQQMGTNNANLYRKDIQTVAIPVFVNRTYRRGLETELTKSVIQQLEEHSPYKVVPQERADTILDCEIVAVTTSTLSFDEFSGLPQDQMIAMVVSFTWKNLRTGEILVQRRNFDQRSEFFPALGESAAIGQTEAIQNLALAIVQEMQADW